MQRWRCLLLSFVFVFLLASVDLLAQSGGTRVILARTREESSSPTITVRSKFISGKVAVDDGSPLTDRVAIQSLCKGQPHTEAFTDLQGFFSFEFGKQREEYADVESTSMAPIPSSPSREDRAADCQLQAVAPGFASPVIELSRFTNDERLNVGTIFLHRLQKTEGITVSASTAAAPPDSLKAYKKAHQDESKGKLEEAEKKLEKAVSIYPRFAVAWVELGRLQAHFKKFDVARQSFEQAKAIEPRLVAPYQCLAQLAFQERKWEELLGTTDQLLRLDPARSPQEWFYNGVANFYLNRFEPAEKSAREGLKADLEHGVPKLDYLLAMVLMQKREFAEAAEHFRSYLAHLPNPAEAAQVQSQLAQAELLAKPTVVDNAHTK